MANYTTEWARYQELAARAAQGDRAAKEEKAKVRQDLRHMEREAARAGKILEAGRDCTADIAKENGDEVPESKRDLQKEYVRKFDAEKPVLLADKPGGEKRETTLRAYHRRRLGL